MPKSLAAALALLVAAPCPPALAQSAPVAAPAAPAAPLTRAEAQAALKALDAALGGYIHADAAERARQALKAGWGDYLAIGDKNAFGERLTRDIGAALDDKHFYVRPGPAPTPPTGVSADAAEAADAYGIAAVRRLPGNVGYLDLRQFSVTPEGGRRIEAAMDLLQDTGALILDLRANRGGGGAGAAAVLGRLASTPIPLSDMIWRENGQLVRTPGEMTEYPVEKRYPRPVYLLTSNRSVSAAEGVAYDLQAAGRVVVVGETTRGGANPMNRPPYDLGAGLRAWVSNGRSEHPITKGTPNGVGVKPDVAVPAADALAVAYARALEGLSGDGAPPAAARELARAKADPQAALASGQ